ncbi:XisI protein [Geminocystis herdmanii]|uniref:XisI protein n=1 Tax=Geminocystis herdmanii TaxID=669359 RepID=UPI000346FA7A|nr:XisI protein [Geminocystis herdmanii]
MVDLKKYKQIVQDLLKEIYTRDSFGNNNQIESQLIFDIENNHYLLVDVGWQEKQYIYGTIIHIDIKGDKIWIQQNNTEINLAEYLQKKGVNKENIVIGLHSPFMRQFSGYAVN